MIIKLTNLRRLSPVCAAVTLIFFFFCGPLSLVGGRLLRSEFLLLFRTGLLLPLVSTVAIVWLFLRAGLDQVGDYGTADTD